MGELARAGSGIVAQPTDMVTVRRKGNNDLHVYAASGFTGAHFDVIISDLMMPVKTGVEFYAELSEQAPRLLDRIIFLTGGAFTVKAREFLDRVSNPCLDKPFDTQRLRALVNERIT